MKILLAPDSFKECLSAAEVAAAMARGVRRVLPAAELVELPLGDGGEGTAAALCSATGGHWRTCRVRGPLGDPVEARLALLGDGHTAVVEMAEAAGLHLLPPAARDPARASTYGVGELIRAALDAGATRLILALGGSATNDGGAGMAQALGARLLDASGAELPPGGAALQRLHRIDLSGLDPRLAMLRVDAACDVVNPLTGPTGASAVFGPQKGATPAQVTELDAALAHYATMIERDIGLALERTPGAGAAGGLGGGAMAFLGARLVRGVELVLEAVGFDRHLKGAALVLTGEGRIDGQTAYGKLPSGVAQAAGAQGVPVVALAGQVGEGSENLRDCGIAAVFALAPGPVALATAMTQAEVDLERVAAQVAAVFAAGLTAGPTV